jgi:hypothetical protein
MKIKSRTTYSKYFANVFSPEWSCAILDAATLANSSVQGQLTDLYATGTSCSFKILPAYKDASYASCLYKAKFEKVAMVIFLVVLALVRLQTVEQNPLPTIFNHLRHFPCF